MVTEVTDVSAISEGNVLVDFFTDTCAPCRAMNPILEEISEEFDNVKVAKVDVARNPDVSQMFGIMSVPTIIFMSNRKVRETVRGLSNKKALTTMIRRYAE
jgi:thioredoxin 1